MICTPRIFVCALLASRDDIQAQQPDAQYIISFQHSASVFSKCAVLQGSIQVCIAATRCLLEATDQQSKAMQTSSGAAVYISFGQAVNNHKLADKCRCKEAHRGGQGQKEDAGICTRIMPTS